MVNKTEYILYLARDILVSLLVVGIIAVAAFLLAGTWPVMVAVQSGSMVPNINIGDVVVIQGLGRTDIITEKEGMEINYLSMGDFGDVIVYRPNGDKQKTPVIHRAMDWISEGDPMPNGVKAPHSGYITKGDHNQRFDQPYLTNPIKKEWVVGVAKIKAPFIGRVRLLFSNLVSIGPSFAL